ncbi:MAG: alpha/beta hydrolase [Bacteroidaceae bacterium]|nr:alpha/beta hydrolase [Bacteroidaceae bacterium]
MKKITLLLTALLVSFGLAAQERQTVWPKGKMPDKQDHQIAAMTNETSQKDFKADKHRVAYLEWFDAPAKEIHNGGCMILISGGSYQNCCDVGLIKKWNEEFTKLGFQCVNFVYRTPRPVGLPIYQSAWEDGQRAVRMVRSQAKKRGFNPEKIGVISMSAGSHLGLLLATSSQTPAYEAVDKLDTMSCHINWAIINAPAYGTTDAESGTPATRQGYGSDVKLSKVFKFDSRTCPMSLHHGGTDIYAPQTSTLVYRQLRRMKVPAELHLYADKGHGAFGLERGIEFMRQMGFITPLEKEEKLMDRFPSDEHRASHTKANIWPEGKMPDVQPDQCTPYMEWHMPKQLKTKAIQIIYSGGSYTGNDPDGFEVAPARRYLNEKGMAVVTLKYRTPRPTTGLAKHTTAWQDLQRTVKLVRKEAESRGLDPNRIGIMGCSAGGHLTLMGVTSSRHQSYWPIDDTDKLSCKVQWGVGIYPAYSLTDGLEKPNSGGGNEDDAVLAPEFSFDLDTAPMVFVHGDADGWAAMNSVKTWEKMVSMGIQSDLHTLATRNHCFQNSAAPGTGSYTYMDRIWEFLTAKGFNK